MSDDTSPSPLMDTVPAPLISSRGPIFERGDVVRHVKSMRLYAILQAPPYAVDENTGAPVYVYTAAPGAHPDPRWWVRPMWEMEETTRFVLHKKFRIL